MGRWVGKNLFSLLLIVAVLVPVGFIQKEIEAFLLPRDAVAALNHGKALLDADLSLQTRQLAKRTASFRKEGDAVVEKWQDKVDAALLPLNLEIRSQEQAYRQNGVARMFGSVNAVIPTALIILLGIVLAGGGGQWAH